MTSHVTVTFEGLTPSEAQNLFASLRCDYNGPKPAISTMDTVHLSGTEVEEQARIEHAMECLRTGNPDVSGLIAAKAKKRGRPRKADKKSHPEPIGAPAKGEPPNSPPAGVSVAGTSPPDPNAIPATIEDVRAALSKLMDAKGMAGCQKVLQELGATRISEIPAAKYAEAVAACTDALA